jgi:hypothetical protein
MWKIWLHAEDDARPRKKCFKTLHGENNIDAFLGHKLLHLKLKSRLNPLLHPLGRLVGYIGVD